MTSFGTHSFTVGDPLRLISQSPGSALENTDAEAADKASATETAPQLLANAFTLRILTQSPLQQSELS